MIRNAIQRSISTVSRLSRPQGPEISTLSQHKDTTPGRELNDPMAELFSENCLQCESEMKHDIEAAYKRVHTENADLLDDTWYMHWHVHRHHENMQPKTAAYVASLDAQNNKYQKRFKKYNA